MRSEKLVQSQSSAGWYRVLFRFFWRELRLLGARVYEPEDFEAAIRLAASGSLPIDRIITSIRPLEGLAGAMEELESGGKVMKILVECAKK